MATDRIDQVILQAVGSDWTKVAMVLARASTALTSTGKHQALEFDVLAKRIEALVGERRLLVRGDITQWRGSEIRKPAE